MKGGAGATGRDRRMFWQFASRAVYWERGGKWWVAQPRSYKDSEVAPNSLAEHSKAEHELSSCSGQPAGSWPQGGLAASRIPAPEMGISGADREKAEIRMTGNKIKTSCENGAQVLRHPPQIITKIPNTYWCLQYVKKVPSSLHILTFMNPYNLWSRYYYHSHFTGEGTELQKGWEACAEPNI